ncbi:sodium:solute symporter family transporter [Actinoplanes derwentensis]|uniref:Sodium:solute symporter family protein n=1 Tax=Actinoplanes derwentensis TaxID=113562 RepID=A0A1H1XKE3_9ACTN|nr:hypothetical protein Ade03nite_66800 [Actinoplanes derwentensis]SDT09623.1 Sodium:solute symporter family protein [Actinoplanes derwentensis]
MWRDHLTQIIMFAVLFLGVSALGFAASRWRRTGTLNSLDEWGLGGRGFGGWITWFLHGGDIYTAYTFVAVPALLFAAGATGFYAVPYTVVMYPLVMLVLVRLWPVSYRHGLVTPADFVRKRYQSPTLALIVAITGIVATATVSKIVSLVVKFGALLFIVAISPQFAIDLQLIGGVIILQTLPAVGIGTGPGQRRQHRTGRLHRRSAGRRGDHLTAIPVPEVIDQWLSTAH